MLEQTIYINLEKNLYYNYIIFLNQYIIENGLTSFIEICKKSILDEQQNLELNKNNKVDYVFIEYNKTLNQKLGHIQK